MSEFSLEEKEDALNAALHVAVGTWAEALDLTYKGDDLVPAMTSLHVHLGNRIGELSPRVSDRIGSAAVSALKTCRVLNATLLCEMLIMDECRAVRDDAFEMIDAAPGRDVPGTAWRAAVLHAVSPLATEKEVPKLLILTRLVGAAVSIIDWDHVVYLMDLWREAHR